LVRESSNTEDIGFESGVAMTSLSLTRARQKPWRNCIFLWIVVECSCNLPKYKRGDEEDDLPTLIYLFPTF